MKIIDGTNYLNEIKELIVEYITLLNRDLAFQSINDELSDLAGKYILPYGRMLAAVNNDGEVIGCVAYHRHNEERCEMKRLFVKPEYRRLNTGGQLIDEIIHLAREDGYKEMVLDTIKPLENAIHLYKKHGFAETEPYYDNPMNDVIYMRLKL